MCPNQSVGRGPLGSIAAAVLIALAPASAAAVPGEPAPTVVGGEPTSIAEAPWHVAVARHPSTQPGGQNGFQRHGCGGSLIAPAIVVTAAHCVFDFGDPVPFLPTADCKAVGGYHHPPSDYSVISGRTELSSNDGEEIDVREIYFFVAGADGRPGFEAQTSQSGAAEPLFDCVSGAWDAVLLELERPSPQRPIRIAGARERRTWLPGAEGTVVGWGIEDESALGKSDGLRSVSLPVIADRYCASEAGFPGRFEAMTMICAGPLEGGAGACGGDSGGGLVVDGSGRARRLVASVSFNEGCGREGKPSVYARLAGATMRPAIARAVKQIAGVDVVGRPRRDR